MSVKILIRFFFYGLLYLQSYTLFASEKKTIWYRYYDNKGIANISTSVTPSHIKYGYESLDNHMQVIKKNSAYNVEKDLQQEVQRANQNKQKESDLRIKYAYTNGKIATQKQKSALENIKKQIIFQQDQLKTLQKDRVEFKRKEMEYTRTGKPLPSNIQVNLKNNLSNINQLKENIQVLQLNYINTEKHYQYIIKRLEELEKSH